jgi:RNA recognition motif-containing protein
MRQDKMRGNVFVANLPPGFTDAQLAEAFDEFGLVLCAYLARDPETGTLRNYGLVDVAPQAAALEAIAALNGREIGGRRIKVREADPDMALTLPGRPRHAPPRAPAPASVAVEAAPAKRTFIVERVPARRRA